MKEQAIIVVSFGTSYPDSRETAIGAIEQAIADAFPEFSQYRAFSSPTIINKLKKRDGLEIDNLEEALKRAEADGIKRLIVQPTYVMNGFEYMDAGEIVKAYRDRFEAIVLAKPLLADGEDYRAVAMAVIGDSSTYDEEETAICLMGHGTEADANKVYSRLQEEFRKIYREIKAKTGNPPCPYFIGTVEARPALSDVMAEMAKTGTYRRAVLKPLMVVSGDHAKHDMAGEGKDSWKSVLEAEGYEVECVLRGLGEFPAIQNIYIAHVQEAYNSILHGQSNG